MRSERRSERGAAGAREERRHSVHIRSTQAVDVGNIGRSGAGAAGGAQLKVGLRRRDLRCSSVPFNRVGPTELLTRLGIHPRMNAEVLRHGTSSRGAVICFESFLLAKVQVWTGQGLGTARCDWYSAVPDVQAETVNITENFMATTLFALSRQRPQPVPGLDTPQAEVGGALSVPSARVVVNLLSLREPQHEQPNVSGI
ncbi:hypothetical protein FB451DRAFT_1172417 [Mycena latifolia]|nr:hypothetical protein FB451DRAFT_1172417 [Mycena latifolia]